MKIDSGSFVMVEIRQGHLARNFNCVIRHDSVYQKLSPVASRASELLAGNMLVSSHSVVSSCDLSHRVIMTIILLPLPAVVDSAVHLGQLAPQDPQVFVPVDILAPHFGHPL